MEEKNREGKTPREERKKMEGEKTGKNREGEGK